MMAPTPLQPALRQVRISDQVASYIVQYIAESRLAAGDVLPSENELARILGVSRPAVREATNALAGRGIIAITTGRAPTVLSLSEGPFSTLINHGLTTGQVSTVQVLDVRRSLEEHGAMLAARHRSAEDVLIVQGILLELGAAVGDVEAFSRVDMAFHRALARATGNVLLSCIMAGMADVALESSRTGLRYAHGTSEWAEILQVHRDIAAAVIMQDDALARRHMNTHFDSALRRLERGNDQEETQT